MSSKLFRLFGMPPPWRPGPTGIPQPPPHSPEWHFKNATSVHQQMQRQMRQQQDALAAARQMHQMHEQMRHALLAQPLRPAPTVAIDEVRRTSRKPALTVINDGFKRRFPGVFHHPKMPEPGGIDPSETAEIEAGIAALEVNTDEMLAVAERAVKAAIERGDEIDTMLTKIRAVRAETTTV